MASSMDTDWRSTRHTIKDRNEYLYNNTLLSDVEFSVVNSEGATVSIPAHKYVLAIGSPVFEAMFFGDLAETSRTINLTDCTAEALLEMLRYLYYDEIEFSVDNILEVIYLAKKYIIPPLVKRCASHLEQDMETEEVVSVLEEIVKLEDEELTNGCWKAVDRETQRAVTSEAFLSVTQVTLCDMLARDGLEITELELFQAVCRWAENKVTEKGLEQGGDSLRQALGDRAIYLLRFPLMTMDEFAEIVLPTEVLKGSEVAEMYRYHNFDKSESILSIFNAKERKGLPRYDNVLWRGDLKNRLQYISSFENSITFTTDKVIYLKGVELQDNSNKACNVSTEIVIYGKNEQLALRTEKESNRTYFEPGVACMKFSKPLLVLPHTEYTLKGKFKSNTGFLDCYRMSPVNPVISGNVTFHFKEKKGEVGEPAFPEIMFYRYFKKESTLANKLKRPCTSSLETK